MRLTSIAINLIYRDVKSGLKADVKVCQKYSINEARYPSKSERITHISLQKSFLAMAHLSYTIFLLTYSNWMAPGLERREEDGQYQNQVMFSLSLIRQVSFCYPLPRLFVKWRHTPLNEEVRTEFGQIYEFDASLASVNQNETMDKQSHRQNKKNWLVA